MFIKEIHEINDNLNLKTYVKEFINSPHPFKIFLNNKLCKKILASRYYIQDCITEVVSTYLNTWRG